MPTAWQLLHNAQGKAFRVASAFKEFPDLSRMPEPQFDEFLASCRLPDYRREELRRAPDRATYYRDAIYWVDHREAQGAQAAFHNFLVQNRIFMTAELRDKFNAVDGILYDVLNRNEVGTWSKDPTLVRSSSRQLEQISEKVTEVEAAVQERLHYGEA